MAHPDTNGSTATIVRRRRGRGHVLVAVVSTALGVIGILPFVMAGYAVEQLVLAPLGLAPYDSTNDDGNAVLVLCGVVAPLAVVAGWAVSTAMIVRGRDLGRGTWALAVSGLVAPTVVFLVGKLS